MQEVDLQAVELGVELRYRVQLGLRPPPVIHLAPVRAHLLEIVQGNALRPVIDGLALRPAGPRYPLAQIVQGWTREPRSETA